jgi:UDP-N-acetylmuramate dehydrogenase
MNKEKIKNDLNSLGISDILIDEPMNKHTTFKVGGPADIFVVPKNLEQLILLIEYIKKNQYPCFVLGNGSNLIVKDGGIRGVVINILDNFNHISIKDDIIEAESGVLLSKLSNLAQQEGLSGLEFACGIPGTLGGAVMMNAGAYEGEMAKIVFETDYLDLDGKMHTLRDDGHEFGYRRSFFSKGQYIILKTKMKLIKKDKNTIKELMKTWTAQRVEKQPLTYPSAGSTFKRPQGHFAGKLIQDAGLMGFAIGGAQVSTKHAGFIINQGEATAKDILDLIKHVQEQVKLKFDVELETEVKVIGE